MWVKFTYVGLIFSAIYAGVLLIILIVLVIKHIRKKRITNWLLENGQKVYAKILDCYVNYRRNFVSWRSKTIICQYKDKVFKDNCFYSSIANFTNKEIAVYFNPDKERQFYIDETDMKNVNE